MALFPTDIGVGYDTRIQPNAGKGFMNAEDGSVVVINKFDTDTFEGTLSFPFCDPTQRQAINDFYVANRNLIWTFEHPGDGITYSLFFLNRPVEVRLETHSSQGPLFAITISVVGTR